MRPLFHMPGFDKTEVHIPKRTKTGLVFVGFKQWYTVKNKGLC